MQILVDSTVCMRVCVSSRWQELGGRVLPFKNPVDPQSFHLNSDGVSCTSAGCVLLIAAGSVHVRVLCGREYVSCVRRVSRGGMQSGL